MALPTDGGGWFPGNLRASFFNGIGLYQALLTQADTGAPTATILSNNLGVDPVWAYSVTGEYTATATGKFTANKTAVLVTQDAESESPAIVQASATSADVISVKVFGADGAAVDGLMNGAFIEIKVFP